MSISLSIVCQAEYEQVADLINSAYQDVGISVGATAAGVAGWARHGTVLVAKVGAQVVGTVTAEPSATFGEIVVHRLAVHPEYQGRGVSRQIVSGFIAAARSTGFVTLAGHSMDSMTTAHRLYEAVGATRDPFRNITSADGRIAYYYRLDL